jgi:hypothetical protein
MANHENNEIPELREDDDRDVANDEGMDDEEWEDDEEEPSQSQR